VRFEWDTEKEKANVTKHGVDFSEATTAFYDLEKLVQIDAVHSGEEPRLLCIRRTRARDSDCSLYLSGRNHSDHRRRLLAERHETL
jgi:uncharacterized DUF497 family protein